MKLIRTSSGRLLAAWLLALGACSDGGESGVEVLGVTQDLGLDPTGRTTLVEFPASVDLGALAPTSFEADAGQTPSAVTLLGSSARVAWDAIVHPGHRVRVVGLSGVAESFVDVQTTDASAPTFGITGGTQSPGLGGDTVTVQFSGPRVVRAEAEAVSAWTLKVGGVSLDLAGSSLTLDESTQTLTLVTGPGANLHASFTLAASGLHSVAGVPLAGGPVAGVASGDSTPPGLVAAAQNLAEDEYGRVVDFVFDEAMDPVFAVALGNFAAGAPDFALVVVQPSAETLRVTFNNPIVPGVDSITLQGVVDAHGNPHPTQAVAIVAGSTAPNAFALDPLVTTVANLGGDYVAASFDQALDPDDATDPTHWRLESPPGTPLDLSGASLAYDLLARSLSITLDQDLVTLDGFWFGGAPGDPPLDVDGEPFLAAFSGVIGGDTTPPGVLAVVQNRNVDPAGRTLDVTFSEDVDQASAEDPSHWNVPGASVQSATLQPSLEGVRVTFDVTVVPGSDTLDVTGVLDLGQWPMVPVSGLALSSSDTQPPAVVSAVASALEGADDDTLVVEFDDDMLPAEAEHKANWSLESPLGTPVDLTDASLVYDVAERTATVSFGAASSFDFQRDDDFRLTLTGMRDLGGNTIPPAPLLGAVTAELRPPRLASAWVATAPRSRVVVRFSEPCAWLDDVTGGTSYRVFDAGGGLRGAALLVQPQADEMGVQLEFAFDVLPGSDTLEVKGLTDMAGNGLFPVLDAALEVQDAQPLDFDAGATIVFVPSGEENDRLQAAFDRRPSPWRLCDVESWSLSGPGGQVPLRKASFEYDGATTLTIGLDGAGAPALATGASYDLSFTGLQTAQGVLAPGGGLLTQIAVGDITPPSLQAGSVRLWAQSPGDTLLLEMNEALRPSDAANTALFSLNGGTAPDSTLLVGPRTVRVTFSGGVTAGDTLDVTLSDLAGNAALQSQAVVGPDTVGPALSAVSGLSVPDAGGDEVRLVFSKPVAVAGALAVGNYTVVAGGQTLDLQGATLRYRCATNEVVIELPAGLELATGEVLDVSVAGLSDHAGLGLSGPTTVAGVVSGDLQPPSIEAAYVAWRDDPGGRLVDVLFSEDLDPAVAGTPSSWSVSGTQVLLAIEDRGERVWRVALSAPLAPADTLTIHGARDLAGNVAGAQVVAPVH